MKWSSSPARMICRSSYEIFGPDEADHAVDQERVERPGHAVGPGLQGELVDAVVGPGREGAPLPGLEVHRLVADPGDVATLVVLEDPLAPLARASPG